MTTTDAFQATRSVPVLPGPAFRDAEFDYTVVPDGRRFRHRDACRWNRHERYRVISRHVRVIEVWSLTDNRIDPLAPRKVAPSMAVGEAPQVRPLSELAEVAAAAGDYVSAARHLRNLATRQETDLGTGHPDLANTLNNLAVVAERAGDLDGAEAAFRRACVITQTAFDATHPSVVTSTRNLREFCEAHGRTYEARAQAPVEPVGAPLGPANFSPRWWSRLVGVGVLGVLMTAAVFVWFLPHGSVSPAQAVPPSSPSTPAAQRAGDAIPERGRREQSAATTTSKPASPAVSTPARARVPSPISVVSATVCRDFSTSGGGEWRCTPVAGSAAAGSFVFYTRVKTTEATNIEHRWYQGDRLIQRVGLPVSANTGAGYRTFSRNTVSPDRSGNWRVELRAQDGAVLSEQSFVVQ